MKLKAFIFLLLFLPTLSYAEERDRPTLSLTPSLNGGMMGVKYAFYSPLVYNGPLVGISLCFSASSTNAVFFSYIVSSYCWLGNMYHKDLSTMLDRRLDFSFGGLAGVYTNSIFSVKVGGALGFMRNDLFTRAFELGQQEYFCFYTLDYDAKMCLSAEWKLPRRWSVKMEDRIPFIAFLSPTNMWGIVYSSDYSFNAFPGNDLRVGVCRTLNHGNCLMLSLRHYCFSSGKVIPDRLQLQFLELGIAFRFGFTKHFDYEL